MNEYLSMVDWLAMATGFIVMAPVMAVSAFIITRSLLNDRRIEAEATASGAGADLSWGDMLDSIRNPENIADRRERQAFVDTLMDPADTAELRLRFALDAIEDAAREALAAVEATARRELGVDSIDTIEVSA